jgi:hypothetical protein
LPPAAQSKVSNPGWPNVWENSQHFNMIGRVAIRSAAGRARGYALPGYFPAYLANRLMSVVSASYLGFSAGSVIKKRCQYLRALSNAFAFA